MKRLEIITFFFFISCAVFAQNTWTSIGPWYASDPRDIAVASNGTMYTIGGTNREIMKSVNQGNSWTHLATPQTDVYCIGVKPDNDQVIIIGTGSSTVVRSVDGGSTWTTITTTSIANRPNKIKFSPVNKSVVFVGTLEATSGEHLFRSKDSGATFTAMTNFVRTTVTDIAFDPTNADTVYISGTKTGTSGLITQGFWRSVNSVSATQPSWSIKISGMTNKNIGAIAIDPSTRANVFCISYSGTWSIYNSTNYGGSWSATTPANAVPAGRDLIAHSSSTFIAATLSGLWETTNSGTSWSAMSVSHMPDTVTQSLAKYTSGGTTYYFCGTTSYVNRSTDVGATWTTVDDGLLLLPLTSVAVKDSINMFALGTASYSGLIWKATDLSGIWTSELDHYIPSTNIAIEGKDIAANNTYVVVSAQKTSSGGPVVLVSADSGGTWFTSYNPGGAGTANQIAFNPDSDKVIYVAGYKASESPSGKVFKTTDAGSNWYVCNIANGESKTIAVDPSSTNIVYAGGVYGVYKSTNYGSTWTAINSGLGSDTVNSLAIDASSSQTLYAGTNSEGVFRSTNGGTSWIDYSNSGDLDSMSEIVNIFVHPINSAAGYISGVDASVPFLYKFPNYHPEQSGLPTVCKVTVDPSYVYSVYFASTAGVYKRTFQWEGHFKKNYTFLSTADIQIGTTDTTGASTGTFYVDSGKTLTIPAGATIKFATLNYIQVFGTLTAVGTFGSNITFQPLVGDRVGEIIVDRTSSYPQANGTFKYCNFNKMDIGVEIKNSTSDSANPATINYCSFNDCYTYGIRFESIVLRSPTVVATRNRIIGNTENAYAGIDLLHSNIGIDSSYILGCQRGILIEDCSPGFRCDTILGCGLGTTGCPFGVCYGGIVCASYFNPPASPNDVNPKFGGYTGTEHGFNIIANNVPTQVYTDKATPFFGDGTSGGYNTIYDLTDSIRIKATDSSTVKAEYTLWGDTCTASPSLFRIDGTSSIDYTNLAPLPPGLVSPADGATGVTRNVHLIWNKSLGAKLYHFQIATTSTFSTGTIVYDNDNLSDTTYTTSTLSASTLYYWRVLAKYPNSNSPPVQSISCWSSVQSFTTGLTKVGIDQSQSIMDKPITYSLHQNYPNPFNPTTQLRYDLPEDQFVSLKVFDVLGREIATLVNEYQSAGYKVAQFDANRLPSGLYFYRLQAGTFSAMKKMMLIK